MNPTHGGRTEGWHGRRGRPLDWLCLLACLTCAAATLASLATGPQSHPFARHVLADGTTYLIATDANGLVFARQAVAPRVSGPLVANVETMDLIDVHDGGNSTGGFQNVEPSGRCLPTFRLTDEGWFRNATTIGGVSSYRPGVSTFHVTFRHLSLPTPFLAVLTLLAASPLLMGFLRDRVRPRGFPVVPLGTAAPFEAENQPQMKADA